MIVLYTSISFFVVHTHTHTPHARTVSLFLPVNKSVQYLCGPNRGINYCYRDVKIRGYILYNISMGNKIIIITIIIIMSLLPLLRKAYCTYVVPTEE